MAENTFQNFLSQIRRGNDYGFSRPNLFYVMFPGLVANEMMSLLCHDTVLPGFTTLTTPYKLYGLAKEIPYELNFDPVRLRFYVDSSFRIPQIFEEYRNRMFDTRTGDPRGNINSFSPVYCKPSSSGSAPNENWLLNKIDIIVIEYKNDGVSDVPQLTVQDTPSIIAVYSLYNAFIKRVDSMNVSWKTQNQIQELSVDIGYEYFEVTRRDTMVSALPINTSQRSPIGTQEYSYNIPEDGSYAGGFDNDPFSGFNPDGLSLADIGSGISDDTSIFVDSSGIGSAFNAATQGILPVMSPNDVFNPVNGLSINQDLFNSTIQGLIPQYTSLPLNFNTINALNPSMATGFMTSTGITGGRLFGDGASSSGMFSSVTNGTNALNDIMRSFKTTQTNVLSGLGSFMSPISNLRNTISTASSLYGSVSRTVKNMPGTIAAQFTDMKYSMPRGFNSDVITPQTRSKPKP